MRETKETWTSDLLGPLNITRKLWNECCPPTWTQKKSVALTSMVEMFTKGVAACLWDPNGPFKILLRSCFSNVYNHRTAAIEMSHASTAASLCILPGLYWTTQGAGSGLLKFGFGSTSPQYRSSRQSALSERILSSLLSLSKSPRLSWRHSQRQTWWPLDKRGKKQKYPWYTYNYQNKTATVISGGNCKITHAKGFHFRRVRGEGMVAERLSWQKLNILYTASHECIEKLCTTSCKSDDKLLQPNVGSQAPPSFAPSSSTCGAFNTDTC